MLPKKHKINKEILKKAIKLGKRSDSNPLYLKVIHIKSNVPAFSFVVSKKISKSAVKRNTIKRRARHAIWKNISIFKPGVAAVFFFKPGSEKINFQEVEKTIIALSKKAGIA